MSKTYIIHITDLHFPHENKNQNVDDKSGILSPKDHDFHSIRKNFLDKLKNFKKTNAQDDFILVVTGDLTIKNDEKGHLDARNFLIECSSVLSISPQQIIICPGNHDFGRSLDRDISQKFFYDTFIDFCTPTEEQGYFVNNIVGIVPINSMDFAKEERAAAVIEAPKIGAEEGFRIERFTNGLNPSEIIMIAAIHHHLIPVFGIEAKPYEILLDAGTFIKTFNQLNFSIVLHGHKHDRSVRFIQDLDSQIAQGYYVIGGNSFAYNKGAFNLITIDNNEKSNIHLQGFQFQGGNYIPIGKSCNLAPKNVLDLEVSSVTAQGEL